MRITTSDSYEKGIPLHIPGWVCNDHVKAYRYGQEPYFQEAFADLLAIHPSPQAAAKFTYVLVKPDGFPVRCVAPLVEVLNDLDFTVIGTRRLRLDRLSMRELWRYELNLAALSRYPIIDRLLTVGDSLFILLHDRSNAPDASARLAKLKGKSDPALRSPDCIRSRIHAGPGNLNHIHSPDELIELIRELGVLFDPAQRRALFGRIAGSMPEDTESADDVQSTAETLYRNYLPHSLDAEEVARRRPDLVRELNGLDTELKDARMAADILDNCIPGTADFWDRITLVNKVLCVSVPGVKRTLDFEIAVPE